MGALGDAAAAVARFEFLHLAGGDGRGFGGVEADSDDVEIVAGAEIGDGVEGAHEAVEGHVAEHAALVIDKREDDRLATKETAKGAALAAGIDDLDVEGDRKSTRLNSSH